MIIAFKYFFVNIYLQKRYLQIKKYVLSLLCGDKMSQNKDDFKRGTAELLVLHCLLKEDLYGYQITHAFEEKTNGAYTMLEGSLYPILYKLEDAGYITGYTVKAGVRRVRKFYHIEESGKRHYEEILKDYLTVTDSIFKILDRGGLHEQ